MLRYVLCEEVEDEMVGDDDDVADVDLIEVVVHWREESIELVQHQQLRLP